jgi:hypothetical protein
MESILMPMEVPILAALSEPSWVLIGGVVAALVARIAVEIIRHVYVAAFLSMFQEEVRTVLAAGGSLEVTSRPPGFKLTGAEADGSSATRGPKH